MTEDLNKRIEQFEKEKKELERENKNLTRILNDSIDRFANGTRIMEIKNLELKKLPDLVATLLGATNFAEMILLRKKMYKALEIIMGPKKKKEEIK